MSKHKDFATSARERLGRILNLRHDMHVCRKGAEWIDQSNEIRDLIMEMIRSNSFLPTLSLPYIDAEDAWCNRDDCGMEDCRYCDELADDIMNDNKDKYNTMIEDWLTAIEKKLDLEENELCPTGNARWEWAQNV